MLLDIPHYLLKSNEQIHLPSASTSELLTRHSQLADKHWPHGSVA